MTNQDRSRSDDDLLQFVRGSLRQSGYYRKRPYTYDHPTPAQRVARALFARIAHDKGRDKFGKETIIDKTGQEKEVPASAVPIMENMKPVTPPEPIRVPGRISPVDRLIRFAELLARASE